MPRNNIRQNFATKRKKNGKIVGEPKLKNINRDYRLYYISDCWQAI